MLSLRSKTLLSPLIIIRRYYTFIERDGKKEIHKIWNLLCQQISRILKREKSLSTIKSGNNFRTSQFYTYSFQKLNNNYFSYNPTPPSSWSILSN